MKVIKVIPLKNPENADQIPFPYSRFPQRRPVLFSIDPHQ